jgi:hypothetical protein
MVVGVCNFACMCDSRTTGGRRSWAFRMLRMYVSVVEMKKSLISDADS